MDAFIQAQKIFPEDAPVGDYDEFNERDMKIAFMATKGIMLVDGKVVDKNSLVVVKKIEAV